MTNSRPVKHTRRKPEEWDRLTQAAQETVPQTSHEKAITLRQLNTLWRPIAELSAENREANLYYGIGQIICEIAKTLRTEPARSEMVHTAARSLIAHARRTRRVPKNEPFVPVVQDLVGMKLERAVTQTTLNAERELPPWHHALTGLLLAERQRQQVEPRVLQPLSKGVLLVEMRYRNPLAKTITVNTFSGAMAVFRTIVADVPPDTRIPADIRMRPVLPEDIAKASESGAFIGEARLRIDEFQDGAGWSTDGGLHFDKSYLLNDPPEITGPNKHRKRLECPAVQAGAFAVEVGSSIVPDIIRASYHMTPAESR